MADRIRHNARLDYVAAHNSGVVPNRRVDWVVLHDEEAPTAQAAASWFANPRSEGSAHLCVDANVAYRCMSDDTIPWAAANTNSHGFHIEQAGYARQSKVQWLANIRLLRRSAFKAAQACQRHRIPVRFVDAAGIAAGRRGITTHAEVSKFSAAARLPGDHSHTDPGANFPIRFYLGLVKAYRLTI